jgi:hypothetical protein
MWLYLDYDKFVGNQTGLEIGQTINRIRKISVNDYVLHSEHSRLSASLSTLG